MSSWYYDDGQGSAVGPYDDEQLGRLVVEGRVGPSTFVLRGDTTNWVPLSSVAAQLGLALAPPPPPPPPPPPAPPGGGGFGPPPPGGLRLGHQARLGQALSPGSRPLAGWLRRVGAAVLDWLIVLIPLNIVLGIAHLTVIKVERIKYPTGRSDSIHLHFSPGGFIVSFVAYVLYNGLLNGMTGQTIGKRIARTRVVDARTGSLIGAGRGVGRAAVQHVFASLLLPGILDDLFPLWDKRRQSLHDKAARTVVEMID